ncbi:hypothetical protein DICPUDRAFT_74427 [Dictyostelium purpureum]|uniref:Uncharacterized protein n=1 Tax=Dictyostelium purpureum TaxID=5786 RepID=F0Z7Q1_DICPU|nr:uncharacterized protein DICPUDRAFT_74427 [Dictyostelium purpureum]EGC40054.1 hypothetical protein DICPUDRAFT_74427 [Dictyostelium purpureum]|eukprot:XP_003283403.1 hypothetical protein DICPUDRAFT_74427 [Dictyostelium purpureum]
MAEFSDIVIDCGSDTIKAGIANPESKPSLVFPSNLFTNESLNKKSSSINQIREKKYIFDCSLADPIKRGRIVNWGAMENVWRYTFNELQVNSNQCNVLLSEMAFATYKERKEKVEIMYEKFGVQNLFICMDAALSLFSLRQYTGLVVDSGYDVTRIIPIYSGIPHYVKHSDQILNIGGNSISKYLEFLLVDNPASNSINSDTVNNIKEQLAYVREEKSHYFEEKFFQLFDGTSVKLKKELYKAPEVLFKPELLGIDTDPLHIKILKTASSVEVADPSEIYRNIYLFGGNSLFPGLKCRIQNELLYKAPKAKVYNYNKDKFSAWVGGSEHCKVLTEHKSWISKEKYLEYGGDLFYTNFI